MLTNRGSGAVTGTWNDRLYFSADATAGGDQTMGTFTFTGILQPGDSVTRVQFIQVPIELSGDRWVVVATDVNNQVYEHFEETNNVRIGGSPMRIILAPLPNLRVASITVPPTGFSGQQTLVSWSVTNAGTGGTSAAGWNDDVWLSQDDVLDGSDVHLGTAQNVSYLNAGEAYASSLAVTLPRGIDGDYYFIVRADIYNAVFELNAEGDNTRFAGPTDITLTPPPDLQVAAVLAPLQAFSGQLIELGWTVTNAGPGSTVDSVWTDRVFLSRTNVLDASSVLLASVNHHGALASGGSYAVSNRFFKLPIGISGPWFFLVTTDDGNSVYEHVFEANNVGAATRATAVSLTPPPDLEVVLVNAPVSALSGRAIVISFEVANSGATATPESFWRDRIYLSADAVFTPASDILLAEAIHSGVLDSGEAYTGTVTATLPNAFSGAWHVFVTADAEASVFELNRTNNTASASTPIQVEHVFADLQPITLVAPATAASGDAILVSWSVTNSAANDTATARWSDRVVLSANGTYGDGDDVTLLDASHDGFLSAGGEYSVANQLLNIPYATAPGTYRLFLVTDSGGNVYESFNEGNNVSAPRLITLSRSTADLQVIAATARLGTSSPVALTVSWAVRNFGAGNARSSSWQDSVYLSRDLVFSNDSILFSRAHVNDLAPGATYSNSFTATIPADLQGQYSVFVIADSDQRVIEDPSENNNFVLATIVSITNQTATTNIIDVPTPEPILSPDLIIAQVDAPATAISGQPFSLTWSARNAGQGAAGQSWYDSVYLSLDQFFDQGSDIYAGYAYRPQTLASGQQYTQTANFKVPSGISGPLYVFVVADGGNSIAEKTLEINNAAYDPVSMLVSLQPPADLVVGQITVPANGVPGQNASITFAITNRGANTAQGSWTDSIYISADDQWDIGDAIFGRVQHFGDVPGGAHYLSSLTAPLPGVLPGDYRVIIRSDILNHLPESNESNNLGGSLTSVAIDAEELKFDVADAGNLSRGESVYYRFNAVAGQTIRLRFQAQSASAGNEMFVRFGQMPTRGQFDAAAQEPFVASPELTIPALRTGTYYVLVYGAFASGSTAYSVLAEVLPFSIAQATPSLAGNVGTVTFDIHGALFDSATMFHLALSTNAPLPAQRVLIESSVRAFATFIMSGVSTGQYQLRAVRGDSTVAVLANPISIRPGNGANVLVDVDGPLAVRRNAINSFTLLYANDGDADTAAPLLILSSPNQTPIGVMATSIRPGQLHLLGCSLDGPLDILRPGSLHTIKGYFSSAAGDVDLRARSVLIDDPAQITDWAAISAAARPDSIPISTWNVFWSRLQPRIGSTWGDYVRVLNELAFRHSTPGQPIRDVRRLFELAFQENPLYVPSQVASGRIVDSRTQMPVSGVNVSAYFVEGTLGQLSGRATTAADGTFTFPFLRPGSYALTAEERSFDMDGDDFPDPSSPRFTVAAGADLSGLTYRILAAEPLPPTRDADPALAVDSTGTLHLIWTRDSRVWHARFSNGEWIEATQINTNSAFNLRLVHCPTSNGVGDESLLALWEEGTENHADIYYARGLFEPDGSVSYSLPQRYTENNISDTHGAPLILDDGTLVIVYLRTDYSRLDDTDLYFDIMVPAQLPATWLNQKPGIALAPDFNASFGWSHKIKTPAFVKKITGLKFDTSIEFSGNTALSGCEVNAGASGGVSMDFDRVRGPRFGGSGSGNIQGSWKVNRSAGNWKFKEATAGFNASAYYDQKGALVAVVGKAGVPGIIAAQVIRRIQRYVNASGYGKLEEGIRWNVGLDFSALKWTKQPPFPGFVLPDSVGEASFSLGGAPYLRLNFGDNYARFSGNLSLKVQVYPEFDASGEFAIAYDGQIGWFTFSESFTWTWGEDSHASVMALSAIPESAALFYNPAGAIGTTNLYGTNSVFPTATNDVFRDGAPSTAKMPGGRVFLAWTRQNDPFGTNMGNSVFVSEWVGGTWTMPVTIPSSSGFNQDVVVIADPLGRPMIVWSSASATSIATNSTLEELTEARAGAEVVYSILSGGSWSSPQPIVISAGPDSEIAARPTGDGRLVVTWANLDGNVHRILAALWDGHAWSAPGFIRNAKRVGQFSLCSAGASTLLFWTEDVASDPDGDEPRLFWSALSGNLWSPAQPFSPVDSPKMAAALAASGGPFFLPPVPDDCLCRAPKRKVRQGSGDCLVETVFDEETCVETTRYKPCVLEPRDPNDIIGPIGFGAERWIPGSSPMAYTIRFENDPVFATASAQEVLITQQLDSDLDPRTFRVGDFGFGHLIVDVPDNRAFYSTRVDLRSTAGYFVDVSVGVDVASGEVFWRFTTIDPATGDLPISALIGFLPPNTNAPAGEGFVSYTIRPRAGAPTGTRIDATATIIFDTQGPIDTPPVFNTIEGGQPSSAVLPLAEYQTNSTFEVSWVGADEEGGSAVAGYDVYVSENGGPFSLWLANSSLSAAPYAGVRGRRYAFYSAARDNAGNVETAPSTPDAATIVSSNNRPALAEIADQFAHVLKPFVLTNVVGEVDGGQQLTFSLGAQSPPGAQLNSSNGIFVWTPGWHDTGTQAVTIIVTDNGVPPLSDKRTFNVVVKDFVAAGLGSVTLHAGQPGAVPVNFYASTPVTSICFTVVAPRGTLTNFVLQSALPALRGATLSPDQTNRFTLCFITAPAQFLQGTQVLAQLVFAAATNQRSGFASLNVQSISSFTTNAFEIERSIPSPGRVVVLGVEPLMEPLRSTNNQRVVLLYGRPGGAYVIESTLGIQQASSWSELFGLTLTNLVQPVPLPPTNAPQIFYRARAISPPDP